ncbi:type II secretion system protein GspL [Maricurvus nonylphenolicus]|uniref:type II secretion system protein GspL n=1 Tax=Maricurvus nonylphenolicus TaxID=1008307 RepID=UPI0036F282AB
MIRSIWKTASRQAESRQRRQRRVLLKIDMATDGSEYYRWRLENQQGKAIQQGSGTLQQLSELVADAEYQLWLLLSGQRILVRTLEFTHRELRHLQHLIPYQLEEELAVDTDKLHFAYTTHLNADTAEGDVHQVTVAVVDKAWLASHLAALADAKLEVDFCVPEPMCLPETAGGWTLRLNGELLVRSGTDSGFGVELSIAEETLALAAEQLPEPGTISLMADSETQLQRLMQLVPKVLRERVVSLNRGHEWEFSLPQGQQLNLLQGEFTKRLPFLRWWQLWRWQLGFLVVLLAVFSGVNMLEVYGLQEQQSFLQSRIEHTYRQVMPEGVLVDAEKQLRRQYALFDSEQQPSQLMPMLADVLPLIASADNIDLKQLQYRDSEKSLRLNIEANSFQRIEALRSAFEDKGLSSKIINANQRRDASTQSQRHQARLQVSL